MDPASFVALDSKQARSCHIDIHWTIDFAASVLMGHVDIKCRSESEGECELTLDSRNLLINNVQLVAGNDTSDVDYKLCESESHPNIGTPIRIRLPASMSVGQEYVVRVEYSTTVDSSALQWLTPEQTTSGIHPFVFSQCQAIHARSLLPCQDVCSVKVTYSATVRYPSSLTALMSAVRVADPLPDPSLPDQHVARFSQKVPIPPYLIAVACGELSSRKVGPRSTVWAEPAVVEKAASEFEDVEALILIAERLCGPYRFGVYDMLVLPPSFPYGGMENPCLTFVTPTLLAGDKSQVAVIAHELAHSWSGNLVTNSTWEHFWLNEGLTVFTETKIVRNFFGTESAELRKQEGWDHLSQYIHEIGLGHNFTRLCPTTTWGEDPDDSFSVVPYEKGAALFWYLESLVGVDNMEKFIVRFFNEFAFGNIDSNGFHEYFCSQFPGHDIDWVRLFNHPGLPSYRPPVDPQYVEEATAVATAWKNHPERVGDESETCDWPSAKKCVFINTLLEDPAGLTPASITSMTTGYKFLTTNCEVRCAFISLMLRVDPTSDLAQAEAVKLATEQGRMKYTRPMYKTLARVNKPLAVETFEAHKKMYHPICAKMIAKDLSS
jgi:leukotriene-A4 hydrolase